MHAGVEGGKDQTASVDENRRKERTEPFSRADKMGSDCDGKRKGGSWGVKGRCVGRKNKIKRTKKKKNLKWKRRISCRGP